MYKNNELLFPTYVIPLIREARGPAWKALVERVLELPETHPEALAFSLTMIRLDGCMACETDSYRAMRGCALCAAQMLRRYDGSDEDLLAMYDHALADVQAFLAVQEADEAWRIA